jgi:hypothetical protein
MRRTWTILAVTNGPPQVRWIRSSLCRKKKTIERARRDKREGKAPTTQAGEFIREEMEHIREGKHGARSTKQAIAIGLSKARRAGVELPPPRKAPYRRRHARTRREHTQSGTDRRRAENRHELARELQWELRNESRRVPPVVQRWPRRHHRPRNGAPPRQRSAAALKAAATKGPTRRSAATRKAARTRDSYPT